MIFVYEVGVVSSIYRPVTPLIQPLSCYRTEFSTAAFRFGHSLIRQTFKVSQSERVDLREMFEAFKTVDKFGKMSTVVF